MAAERRVAAARIELNEQFSKRNELSRGSSTERAKTLANRRERDAPTTGRRVALSSLVKLDWL